MVREVIRVSTEPQMSRHVSGRGQCHTPSRHDVMVGMVPEGGGVGNQRVQIRTTLDHSLLGLSVLLFP